MNEFKTVIDTKNNDTLRLVYKNFQNQINQEKSKCVKLRNELKNNEENPQKEIVKEEDEEEKNSIPINTNLIPEQDEKLKNINEIYEKTMLVSDISKNINEIVGMQDKKIETIESNINTGNINTKAAKEELDVKHSKVEKEYSNNTKLAFYLILLIVIFLLLIYITKN
ncbi:MAG: hypothetical protein MJ252_02695 [archaeon]|nr:hypothetical protein [archaeon]